MAGHGRPKDGVALLAYDPGTHEATHRPRLYVSLQSQISFMDRRVKPGDDGGACVAPSLSQNGSVCPPAARFQAIVTPEKLWLMTG
jgi:hypothetical protein